MRQRIAFVAAATLLLLSGSHKVARGQNTISDEVVASRQRSGDQFTRQVHATAIAVENARAELNRAIHDRRSRYVAMKEREDAEAEAKKRSLDQIISAMKPNPALEHLPDCLTEPPRPWSNPYKKVASGLRGNITYKFEADGQTGKRADVFQASDEQLKSIRGNLKIIAWYRDQLEQKCSGEAAASHRWAYWFRMLLDEVIETLAKGMPKPKVSLDGEIEKPVLELDERTLWSQLSCVYRCVHFKQMVYENADEFVPADLALMEALQKLSVLHGAEIEPAWFETVKVDLSDPNVRGWKKEARMALLVLQMKANGESKASQELACVIPIPEKPKPQPPPKPPVEERKVRILIEGVGVPAP